MANDYSGLYKDRNGIVQNLNKDPRATALLENAKQSIEAGETIADRRARLGGSVIKGDDGVWRLVKDGRSASVEREAGATKGNAVANDAMSAEAARIVGEADKNQGAGEAYGLGFNIGNFKAEMDEYSILHTHSYLVVFAPFSSISKTIGDLNEYILDDVGTLVLRCDQAVLPGPRLLTVDNVRRYGYGPVETHAHGVQFQNVTLTWIVDKNARVVDFFNKWMKRVVNFESEGGGNMERVQTFGSVPYAPYEVGYKDDYSNSLMAVYVYDPTLNGKTIEYLMYDVFPTAIHNVDVQWGSFDNMLKISVDFAYTDIRINTPKSISNLPPRVSQEMRELSKPRSTVEEKPPVKLNLNRTPDTLPRVITGNRQEQNA